MNRTLRILFAALLSLAARGASAEAAAQKTVALAAVEARGSATAEQAAELNDAVVAQLVNDGKLRVVERQQMARVMKEQALSQSGAMSDEVQIKLAQLVGARTIVVGAVQGSGKGLMLSLRAMDSSTGQVTFAENLKIGSAEQISAGAHQLAQKLESKLTGTAVASNGEAVGDFDVGQVKDSARALARSLSLRFPRITGRIVEYLPDGSATCSFGSATPFEGQLFEVTGRDDVTESTVRKGYFLLKGFGTHGCSGRVKRDGPGEISSGDSLSSTPLKFGLDPLQAGAGTDAALAKLLTDETVGALKGSATLTLGSESPQLNGTGRVTGPRGHRTVEVQVVDKAGNVVQSIELPGNF